MGIGVICAAGQNLDSCMRVLSDGTRPQLEPNIFSDYSHKVEPHPDSTLAAGTNFSVPPPVCMVNSDWVPSWKRCNSAADTLALGWVGAEEALIQAGLNNNDPKRMGVCMGTTAGSALHFLNGYAALRGKFGENKATQLAAKQEKLNDIEDYFSSNLAAVLAKKVNARGPLLTITNACTSGTDALGVACKWLKLGLCDYVLAGGADALGLIPYTGFQRLLIYSSEPCAPFDQKRTGLNLGEGAGVMVLELAEHAQKRGAQPLTILSGYGTACDAHHVTAPSPEGRGLQTAISKAMCQAGISPADLAFVNAHGTATRENDKVEGYVLNKLLPQTPVWASKGATGHCLGAAGAIEAAFASQALLSGTIPASVGCKLPEESVCQTITLRPTKVKGNFALSISLGFGGENSALVLKLPG